MQQGLLRSRVFCNPRMQGVKRICKHGPNCHNPPGSRSNVFVAPQVKRSLLNILEERGYMNQIVGERHELDQLLQDHRISAYAGIDPTAPSMHLGHLLPLMALYWVFGAGHTVYAVVGKFTAKIGDPTGRTTARATLGHGQAEENSNRISDQLETMAQRARKMFQAKKLERVDAHHAIHTISNSHWQEQLSFSHFASIMGVNARLGPLLGRDTVKSRIQSGDGMSVSEFLYPLIQAWDWWHLYSTNMAQIQIGGADQFGNILSGAEAISSITKNTSFNDSELPEPLKTSLQDNKFLSKALGFTIPLLTTSSGDKFGKSAGNAVWLDKNMTSPFDLYQFLVGTADADVHRYLKLFTFEPLQTLEKLMQEHERDQSKRLAQKHLAQQVLLLVHGPTVADTTKSMHDLIFQPQSTMSVQTIRNIIKQEDAAEMNEDSGITVLKSTQESMHRPLVEEEQKRPYPRASSLIVTLPKSSIYGQPLARVFYYAGLVESKMEGQRLQRSGGTYVAKKSQSDLDEEDTISFAQITEWSQDELDAKYIIGGEFLVIRAGKQRIKLIRIVE